jgi:hypothetical protein
MGTVTEIDILDFLFHFLKNLKNVQLVFRNQATDLGNNLPKPPHQQPYSRQPAFIATTIFS